MSSPTSPVACTIVSNNYLPFARTFARSFLEHNPGGRVFVLLVDRPSPALDYSAEPFEALFAADIGIPSFPHFAFRYSILELNTAVKPFLIEHLHRDHGVERLCYFDPDILVTAPLDELYGLFDRHGLVLTPHILEPIDDDATPSERDFLLSGIYNLGFVGLRLDGETLALVRWWQRRLYHDCLHRVEEGLFVDQKWMDFGPSFVDSARVLRDPGYNVAYWNLMHRSLEGIGPGEWMVRTSRSSGRLRFFHFSGFDPRVPDRLSKYQNRLELTTREDLAKPFDVYARRLFAEGYRELRDLPYGFGSFDNGVAIPPAARELLRDVDPDGERWVDPFDTDGPDSFYDWLRGAARPTDDGAPGPCRAALGLWRSRVDLRRAFPEPEGRDRVGFLEWLADGGIREGFPEAFSRPGIEDGDDGADGRTPGDPGPGGSESPPSSPPATAPEAAGGEIPESATPEAIAAKNGSPENAAPRIDLATRDDQEPVDSSGSSGAGSGPGSTSGPPAGTPSPPPSEELPASAAAPTASELPPWQSGDFEDLDDERIAFLTAEASLDGRRRPRVPRLAEQLREERPDLQRLFSRPFGRDRRRFALWYVTSGRVEHRLPDPLVNPVLATLSLKDRLWARAWWLKRRLVGPRP